MPDREVRFSQQLPDHDVQHGVSMLQKHTVQGVRGLVTEDAASLSQFIRATSSHVSSAAEDVPAWLQMLVTGTIAAIIVLSCTKFGAWMTAPYWFFPTDEQKLKSDYEEAQYKADQIKDAIEAQKTAQWAEKEAEENRLEEQRREAEGDPEQTRPDPWAGFKRTVGTYNSMVNEAAPLLQRATHASNTFQEGVEGIKVRMEDMAKKEAAELVERMKVAMDTNTEVPQGLPEWASFLDFSEYEVEPPPVALLIAGMLAPAQLRSTRNQCKSTIAWDTIMVSAATIALILDWKKACGDTLVMVFFFGFLGLNVLDLLCRTLILMHAARAVRAIEEEEEAHKPPSTGNSIWDAYNSIRMNSRQFFKALFQYDNLLNSWSYLFTKYVSLISAIWGAIGLYTSIANVVMDETQCDKKVTLYFMHVYSFFYLMFLLINLASLLFWILQRLSESNRVSSVVVGFAKSWDKEVPLGIPVFMTLVQAFVLRNSNDMLRVKAQQIAADITILEAEKAAAMKNANSIDAKIAKMKQEAEKVAEQEKKAKEEGMDAEGFVERYDQKAQESLAAAEPLLAVAAARVGEAAASSQEALRTGGGFAGQFRDDPRAAAARLGAGAGELAGSLRSSDAAGTLSAGVGSLRAGGSDVAASLGAGASDMASRLEAAGTGAAAQLRAAAAAPAPGDAAQADAAAQLRAGAVPKGPEVPEGSDTKK